MSSNARIPSNTRALGFVIGERFLLDDSMCELVLEQSPTQATFRRFEGNHTFSMSRDEFVAAYSAERIKFPYARRTKSNEIVPEAEGAPSYDIKNLPIGDWRQHFVSAFRRINASTATRAARQAAINEAFAIARTDPSVPDKLARRKSPPSLASVYRWVGHYNPALGPISLIPDSFKSGRDPRRIHPIYEQIIKEGINWFIRTANARRNGALAVILDDIHEAAKSRPELQGTEPPDKSTIYRRIRALGGETLLALSKGRRVAHRKYAPVGAGFQVALPLERVEMDMTTLDRLGLDLLGTTILSRAHVITLIDVCTRMPLAVAVSLTAPRSVDIRRLLRKAILPKCPEMLRHMGVESPWPACGIPKTIVTDNGKDYVAEATKHAFHILDIDHKTNPPRAPSNNPHVERNHLTQMLLGIHEGVGSTMSNPKELGERKPETEALEAIDRIEAQLIRQICDTYNRRTHRMLGCSPLAAWERLAARADLILPDPELLRRITEESDERHVTHQGVQINNIFYNSDELADIHRASGRSVAVKVHWDPYDLTNVHVEDPMSRRRIVVRCVNDNYAAIDLRTLEIIRSFSKDNLREEDEILFRRNRARAARYAGELAGPRPAHLLPKGFKPERPAKKLTVKSGIEVAPDAAQDLSAARTKSTRRSARTRTSSLSQSTQQADMSMFVPNPLPEEFLGE